MAALPVIEDLDVFEDFLSGLFAGFEILAPDPFVLDRCEEAFRHCVVAGLSRRLHESETKVHVEPRMSKIGHAHLRRSTCSPWSPARKPLGVAPSAIDAPATVNRPKSSSVP
jgi:hypothetical protein